MKIKYNNKIIFFFIVIFSFIIVYYILGKLNSRRIIIEGNTVTDINKKTDSNQDVKKSCCSSDTKENIEMKKKIKIMNKYISSRVDPKVTKLLENIKDVSDKANEKIKKETESKLNVFSTKNDESKRLVPQKKVPPFSGSEINSSF